MRLSLFAVLIDGSDLEWGCGMEEELNLLVMTKGGEHWVFIWDDLLVGELLRLFGRMVSDSELGFSWVDAAKLSQCVRDGERIGRRFRVD